MTIHSGFPSSHDLFKLRQTLFESIDLGTLLADELSKRWLLKKSKMIEDLQASLGIRV